MKAVLTVKLKEGYLVMENDIDILDPRVVAGGVVVSSEEYGSRDKVGRVASEILDSPAPEAKDEIPF